MSQALLRPRRRAFVKKALGEDWKALPPDNVRSAAALWILYGLMAVAAVD